MDEYCAQCGRDDSFFQIDYCYDFEEMKHYHRWYCSNCGFEWTSYEEEEDE